MSNAGGQVEVEVVPSRSVQRRSLPYPFIHEFGALDHPAFADLDRGGHALAGDLPVEAELLQQFPGGTVVIRGVQMPL